MNREEHNRIVQAGLKKMGVKPIVQSDLERLLQGASRSYTKLSQHITMLQKEALAAGKSLDPKLVVEDIQPKLLDEFYHYNKDELLFILCAFCTEKIVQSHF